MRKLSEIIRFFAHRLPNGCPILEPLQARREGKTLSIARKGH